jgi:hypothetical protein
VETTVLQKLLKMPIAIKTGYNGNQDQLAMRRGEIVGTIASRSSWQQFVDNGYGRFIAQIGGSEKDVPQLSSLVSDSDAKAFIDLVASQGDLSRLTAGPANIPKDRLNALRQAYDRAMSDPELQAKAKKIGRPIEARSGDEVEKRIKAALNQPPATIELITEALSKESRTITVSGKIETLNNDNKGFTIANEGGKKITGTISGSRTQVSIKGDDARRESLKVGMQCTVVLEEGAEEAKKLAC